VIDFDDFCTMASDMRANEASLEEVLSALRAAGASQLESHKVIWSVEGGRLGDWKQLVTDSPTWADRRAGNQALRHELVEALAEEADTDS
jgi:hypothetical protein